MNNEQFLLEMGSHFKVYNHEGTVELETWTNGGVNMIISLDINKDMSLLDQFNEYVARFDVDEEVLFLMENDSSYRSSFSLSASISDFKSFHEVLNGVLRDVHNEKAVSFER